MKPEAVNLCVVVPAYNEAKSLHKSINLLHKTLTEGFDGSFKILVVNDGSTDETRTVFEHLNLEGVRLLDLPTNKGKGSAIRAGFREANSDLIAQIDADLDLHPDGLLNLIEILRVNNCDVVVGSKVHPKSIVRYPRVRRIQSRAYRMLVQILFGLKVSDTQTGMKLYTKEVIDTVLPAVRTRGFSMDLEMLALAEKSGFTLCEGPIQLDFQFTSTLQYGAALDMLKETAFIWFRLTWSNFQNKREAFRP
jgi:glycosyltransferase involved in cell wall biosynthesis